MAGVLLSIVRNNPLLSALALVAALFAALSGYQKLANIGLELKLSRAEATTIELRGAIALHHANERALKSTLERLRGTVTRWQVEADERREAAGTALELAKSEAIPARARIVEFRSLEGESCNEAVGQVREVWGL